MLITIYEDFCNDVNLTVLIPKVYKVIVVAELAKKLLEACNFDEEAYKYLRIIKTLNLKCKYRGDVRALKSILSVRNNIVHLINYNENLKLVSNIKEELFTEAFEQLRDIEKFLLTWQGMKPLDTLIDTVFDAELLATAVKSLQPLVYSLTQEIAVDTDTITITKEQYETIKNNLPPSVFKNIFNN